jgi:hypothetical protein
MRRALAATAMLLCLLAPAPASASRAGGERLIADCAKDGEVDRTDYTQDDYQYALANMPTDLKEYSSCPEIIRDAQAAAARGAGGGGGGGAFGGIGADGFGLGTDFGSPTPRERGEIARAQRSGSASVPIGDTSVFPGGAGLGAKAASHPLPTSLLILLILMGLGLAARSFPAVRRLLPALRPLADRVFPRRSG